MSTRNDDIPLPLKMIFGIIGLFLVVVLIAFVIRFFMGREPEVRIVETATVISTQIQKEFRIYMITRSTERVGQPIEGFDADVLMLAFPGLLPKDFDNVKTLEGHYVYNENELTFAREEESFASTAEQTISEEGYVTLLSNLVARFNVNLEQPMYLEEIYSRIN